MDFAANLNASRILVAESDPDVMDHIASLLVETGYNVQKAYFTGDALYALGHGQYDLALIDVSMRNREQFPLTDQMVEFEDVRWIALVDHDHPDPHQFLQRGASAFIRLPFQPDTLLAHIEHVLKGQRMATPAPLRPSAAAPEHADGGMNEMLERRLVEQQTLSTLTRSLSAVLDLDTLLTQVVEAAVMLCGAEEGLLLLPDDEGQALYIRAVKGIDSETARNFRIKTQDSLAGEVFRTGQPILVGDRGLQKIKTEYLVRSLLYVALSIKGQIIGVLGVNNKHSDRTFTEHDVELLQDLAAHAAVAIENARLYEESVLRTRELSTLVQASQAANSTLAFDQVLSIIAGQLIGALDVSQCYIGEWVADQQRLETLAVCYRALWKPTAGPRLRRAGDAALAHALKHRRAVIAEPDPPDPLPECAAALPHRYHVRQVVSVPLLSGETLIGVVRLYYIHATPPDEAGIETVEMRARQLALEMVPTLAGPNASDHRKTLFRNAQRLLDATNADWCEIALCSGDQQTLHIMYSYGEAIWRADPKPWLDPARFPGLARMLSEQKILTGSPAYDLAYLADIEHGKSVLGVPLVVKGETAGLVLLVDTLQGRNFARREVDLARALVVQAANALSNARLYRDLEISLEELHRAQSKLVQTARLSAMGELAAAVAHQINNPLTTILGDTELILRDLPKEDENFEALEAISRAGKRAHEVVRRLLAMARQQSTDDMLEPIDVNQTITNTLTLVRSHIQQGNVNLVVLLDETVPAVNAIQGQLEDVWLNLLLNARDAVVDRANPKIGIATKYRPESAQVEVVVWDNGVGIPQEQLDQIFEPFYTTKLAGEGTGLGLHICRQIVRKCHGAISVQSTYNEGTCFTIRLPVNNRRDAV